MGDLCAARATVEDPEAAADVFARDHGRLHDLARELADADRGQATRFLEAKQQVESALNGDFDSGQLAGRLDRLPEARATSDTAGCDLATAIAHSAPASAVPHRTPRPIRSRTIGSVRQVFDLREH